MKPATTVTKVCRVLGEFKKRPSAGVTELARSLDMFPSDVHRILVSLQAHGYVEQNAETKRYQPGAGLMRLGLTVFQRNILQEKGGPVLLRLSEQLDAATHLAMLDSGDDEVFLVDQVQRPGRALFVSQPGTTAGPHSTALGKTIMANADDGQVERALRRSGLRPSTGHTITALAALKQEFAMIRRLGYAVDREESAEGACCIGFPLRNCAGAVIGAISASMRVSQFQNSNFNHLASRVDAAAAELSYELGWEPESRDQ
jgi:DNA-binding IclR family transcriptional regulator